MPVSQTTQNNFEKKNPPLAAKGDTGWETFSSTWTECRKLFTYTTGLKYKTNKINVQLKKKPHTRWNIKIYFWETSFKVLEFLSSDARVAQSVSINSYRCQFQDWGEKKKKNPQTWRTPDRHTYKYFFKKWNKMNTMKAAGANILHYKYPWVKWPVL